MGTSNTAAKKSSSPAKGGSKQASKGASKGGSKSGSKSASKSGTKNAAQKNAEPKQPAGVETAAFNPAPVVRGAAAHSPTRSSAEPADTKELGEGNLSSVEKQRLANADADPRHKEAFNTLGIPEGFQGVNPNENNPDMVNAQLSEQTRAFNERREAVEQKK